MSKEKYEHLIGRECVLQPEGGRESRGVVSDVGKDGVLFIHEDTAQGVPLIAHDKISRLVLAESAEKEKPEKGQEGVGARTRQPGDRDTEHAAPDEPPRAVPGLQAQQPRQQPAPSPAGTPVTSPASGPPARQPLHPGEVPAVPPHPEKDIDERQQRPRVVPVKEG
jgi:hypothetical protein